MLAGPAAYALIRRHESIRLRSYLDQKGVWTIGWGHTGDDVGPGMLIGLQDAQRLLDEDVHFAEFQLNRMLITPVSQNEFDALVSLLFNIGQARFKSSSLLRFLNFGERKKAGDEFLRWDKVTLPNGKKIISNGLSKRRKAERDYFLTGILDQ